MFIFFKGRMDQVPPAAMEKEMIFTIVQGRTFDRVAGGERAIYFRYKPHWHQRFAVPRHNSILLLSGHRSICFRITEVKDTGGSYAVHLGEEIRSHAKQEPLFRDPIEKGLRVAGKGMPEAVDLGDASRPGQRKGRVPRRESKPLCQA
jgi:hypothetical protein